MHARFGLSQHSMSQAIISTVAASLAYASVSLAQPSQACKSPIPVPLGASVEIVQPSPATRSLSEVLSGRVPGVSVMRSSGVAGTGSRIRIRGPSGILIPQQPLLYVDGIRADGEQQSIVLDAGGQAPSRLDDIPAEQIECVYVLRGPAATARYGTDAAGGVIHVITRRVASQSAGVNLFLDGGVAQDGTNYPANFGTESASPTGGCSRAAAALGRCVAGPLRSWSPLSADSPFRTSPLIRGGGFASRPGTTLSLGIGAHASREEGVLINNEHTQYGANGTARWHPLTSLELESDLWYMGGHANLPQVGGLILSILNSALLGASVDDPIRRGYRNVPLSVLKEFGTDQTLRRFGGTVRTHWKIASWLDVRAALGYEDSRANDEQFDPQVVLSQPPTVNPPRIFGTSELSAKRTSANLFLTAGYRGRAVSHSTEVGIDYLEDDQVRRMHVRDIGTPSFFESTSYYPWDAATKGLIVHQSFAALEDRLQLDAGVRHDLLDDQFFDIANPTYPFASASWQAVTSRDSGDRRALSSLRLRAAYGESGDKRPFRSALSFAVAVPPYSVGSFRQPEVERTREIEGGFDLGLFGDRGSVRATYFSRRVSNAYLPSDDPPGSSGPTRVASPRVEWMNRGLELAVHARAFDTPNIRAEVDLSLTTIHNELVSLGNGPPISRVFDRLQVGYPLFGAWARELTVTDQNNDGVIVPDEVVDVGAKFVGSPVPTREIGVMPSISFRRALTLSALFDYRAGFRAVNQTGRQRCLTNCAELYVPGVPFDQQARINDPVDALTEWIEDASFLKLRELTLAYAMRASNKRTIRVVVSGRNLWTRTDYTGLDPEVSLMGQSAISQFEFFTLPIPRSYSVRFDMAW